MCAKQLWKNDISRKEASHWLESLHKISNLHRYFSLFQTFCYQLPDFSVSGTFAAKGQKPKILTKTLLNYAKKKIS